MLKVKSGDLDRMGLLFQRYHRPFYGFCYHMTGQREVSEDMVQNVFYRMIRSRHTFTGDGEFKTWMYHLAGNVVKDHYKKAGREWLTGVGSEWEVKDGVLVEEELEKKIELETLQKRIASLSPESREVLILSRYQDLKYAEIAEVLNDKSAARAQSLKLNAINDGSITVTNVSGELEINNVNGPIALKDIAGSVVANTVNGAVVVNFKSIDTRASMAFSTLNGNVDVTFPSDFKSNVKLKTDQGGVYTDFDIVADKSQPSVKKTEENHMYRITIDEWVYGKINGGGPEMMMKTMTGSIYIRKGK